MGPKRARRGRRRYRTAENLADQDPLEPMTEDQVSQTPQEAAEAPRDQDSPIHQTLAAMTHLVEQQAQLIEQQTAFFQRQAAQPSASTSHMESQLTPYERYSPREPYSDDKVPWTYEGGVGNLEQQFNVMGVTRSGLLYENPAAADKGKALAAEVEAILRAPPTPPKKMTEEEAESFMKIIKASEYKVVEQMAKSPAQVSLLALFLNSEPHREALLRVLTAPQVPKGTPPDRIEETEKARLGDQLGRIEGPAVKGEESTKRTSAMPTSSSRRRGKEVSVNAVNPARPTSQQYSINYTPLPPVVPAYTPPAPQYQPQPSLPVVHRYASTPPQAPQYRPASSGAPQLA
ncbi:hypothetical protein CRG98_008991 [Punica granatum]|uniref:Uncharacterized protein n=1 Tax=Punica granatum TaxID=22663 RepID=A0A2I0KQ62_PUNGR|nr:hypothetical protein CRG98_008991 [Punica granatum]